MGLSDREGLTYSFAGAQTLTILKELIQILMDMGVDIRDSAQLKQGYEKLFNIEYHNLPDFDAQGYILAPNHISDFDALILGLLHPNIKIMSKSDWVENEKLMAFLSPHYQLVGIDRKSDISQAKAMVEIIQHLKKTAKPHHALIFPQGTISDINKNSIERVQRGVFVLSSKANTPVLPLFIEQPNFDHPTRIVFGEPMDIPERREDRRQAWMDAVIALENTLVPPARIPVLTEKHANNNKPGDPFF